PPHHYAQGIVQMIGVLTDTIVICYDCAMIMLVSGGAEQPSGSTAGIHWVQPVSYTNLTLPTTQRSCRTRWSPYT
ncbi:alanine:cation symporter family protein, partial [Enterobacter hormaechei]